MSLPTGNLVVQLESNNLIGYTDGDDVGTWTDQSGSSNDFVQVTALANPHYKGNITPTGLAALDFDGADDSLGNINAAWASLTSFTFFVVVQWTTGGGAGLQCLVDGYHTGSQGWVCQDRVDLSNQLQFSIPNNGASAESTGALGDGNWHVISGRYDNSTKVATLYCDGVEVDSTAGNANALNFQSIITLGASTIWGRFLNGYIAAFLLYDAALGTSDLTDANNYLGTYYLTGATEIEASITDAVVVTDSMTVDSLDMLITGAVSVADVISALDFKGAIDEQFVLDDEIVATSPTSYVTVTHNAEIHDTIAAEIVEIIGADGSVEIEEDDFVVLGYGGDEGNVEFSLFGAAGTLLVGTIADGSVQFSEFAVSSTVMVSILSDGAIVFPEFTVAGIGVQGLTAVGAVDFSEFSIAAEAVASDPFYDLILMYDRFPGEWDALALGGTVLFPQFSVNAEAFEGMFIAGSIDFSEFVLEVTAIQEAFANGEVDFSDIIIAVEATVE